MITASKNDIEFVGFQSGTATQGVMDWIKLRLNEELSKSYFQSLKEICAELELPRKAHNPKTLLVNPFSSDRFTETSASESADGRTLFVTDHSSLDDFVSGKRHLERLYDDSKEVGLAIRFEKSGKVAAYKLEKVEHDVEYAEGAAWWEYAPTKHSLETVPECKNSRVFVYND